ncbi:MAG: hypothetical protein JWO36_6865 [Myxococcales bacterium]|nr:hypothetical protein [Myxococcales bacterium]
MHWGLVLVALVGCTRTFSKEAVQPNPLLHPTETLRSSERIRIVTGDMDLDQPVSNGCNASSGCSATTYHNAHYPLINEASFTMVSRDRLRFHVQVDHKWEDWADLKTWDVELVDDKGRKWVPESVEHARTRLITTMWDREQRTAICSSAGRDPKGDCISTVGFQDDGWRRRQTLGSLSVFRGNADFVFYQRDLFTADVRWMKLIVKRTGEAFEFTWRFQDYVASE